MSTVVATASVTAEHADSLRVKRDRSDNDIRAEYMSPPSRKQIAKVRRDEAGIAAMWVQEAVKSAASNVMFDYESIRSRVAGVDDFTVTVTVTDMVATATLSVE